MGRETLAMPVFMEEDGLPGKREDPEIFLFLKNKNKILKKKSIDGMPPGGPNA